ncbi:MAG: glycosyltransferase involved in cell wall biosynthesis [Actinomycetes bacterium]|jgi:glycosyltransferase involved in cell wall biosynthesis
MSAEVPPQWATGLADAFAFESKNRETQRELDRVTRRANRAEKELAKIRTSAWWRVSGPLRRRGARSKPEGSLPKTDEKKRQIGPRSTPTDRPHAATENLPTHQAALVGRLVAVLHEYDEQLPESKTVDNQLPTAIAAISRLIAANSDDRELAWVTYIAIIAEFPRSEDMLLFHTGIKVAGAARAIARLLATNTTRPKSWAHFAELELVREVVVDPTSTSHRDSHTGIQRVVREAVTRWTTQNRVELMIWGGKGRVFRPPTPLEVLRATQLVPTSRPKLENDYVHAGRIRVPWRTQIIVPEPTSQLGRAQALECLAEWSSNEVAAIFYDLIMYAMPESLNDSSRIGLTNYIPVLRSATRISTISAAVKVDLEHFLIALRSLGLSQPKLAANLLPVTAEIRTANEIEMNRSRVEGVPGLPIVLSVGSLEPRKNQLMTLRAAEMLWNEGLQFQLLFIGWASWRADDVIAEIESARASGRPVRIIRQAEEELLWSAYAMARFSMYISISEGYGLPIGESLAAGTPVITSNYGSMAEVAEYGGATTVDPRGLTDVSDAMRTLLCDDAELARLTSQIGQRDARDWDGYAEQTWSWLVDGV